ncbi:LysM peptidoglycan-binding domain-containing protein [Limimaricola sp. G21655-S1]|uniref:LysM peptidoglycan-binding domain-containing protein n=1 Tax=Limimaricola sp. G21655-S1 TaxID=3014768 RepID=UPI0022AEA922|nr:LysM peptidoglycan-binding domain-containing protein [Limimaricola sp. G21655-S1]MCZ4260549.1 LysM peptidoglycan-binding domain-containing protein [Limimaricola sp. G21655-S1]
MIPKSAVFRTTAVATTLAGAMVVGGVAADTRCGVSYTIQPDDTLYSVAQQCRVALATIMHFNPNLDVDAIPVGARIRLAKGPGSDGEMRTEAPGSEAEGSYRVKANDTAYSIAATLDLSLQELMAENPDLDPLSLAIGEVLNLPRGNRSATVNLSSQSGPPGSEVTVMARDLRPDDWVTIGAGRQSSEWQRIREVQVAGDGEVRAEVEVPGWAGPEDVLTFVVDTDRGMTYKSGDFEVTARGGEDREDGDDMALEGHVNEGVECYTLITPDGDRYALVSDDVEFTPGEYVEIEGDQADVSICMQGQATVDVTEIREVRAPSD